MSKCKVLRREFVTAAFCAVLSAPPPAHAQSHPAGPKATILPCEGPCALMQWARLAISLPGAKKLPITITTGPGGDWKHAAIGRDAPPFRCDLPDNPTVETILAMCGKGK